MESLGFTLSGAALVSLPQSFFLHKLPSSISAWPQLAFMNVRLGPLFRDMCYRFGSFRFVFLSSLFFLLSTMVDLTYW